MKINESVECLNYAESLIIWSLRKISQCSVFCAAVEAEFLIAFGDNSYLVLMAFRDFVYELSKGNKPLKVGLLSNEFLTSDEASILSLLSASNVGLKSIISAHASWILARPSNYEGLIQSSIRLVNCFKKNNFHIEAYSFARVCNHSLNAPLVATGALN